MVLATLLVVFVTSTASAAPPLPGAIFTTLHDGTRVNANIYQAKCDNLGVWLDGGPGPNAPAGAAGLPEGDYFFQVTDPSGKNLLSTDAVKFRQFHVGANGFITGVSGAGNHQTDTDTDHGSEGARTIELCAPPSVPFLDTPNPGGVYKAWVTPVGDYVGDINNVDNPCSQGCSHGFIHAASKTDNFKVRGQPGPCLNVFKFIDANGDGDFTGDTFVNWPITVFDPLGTTLNGVVFTPPFGPSKKTECLFPNLTPGVYRVVEAATNDSGTFIVTANILDGRSLNNPDTEVLVRIRSSNRELIFGNQPIKK